MFENVFECVDVQNISTILLFAHMLAWKAALIYYQLLGVDAEDVIEGALGVLAVGKVSDA